MPVNGGWTSTSMPYLVPQGATEADAWTQEAAARGGTGRQRIVFAGETDPPAEVASLLGVESEGRAVVRRRVIYLDDRPVELTDSFYPLSIAGGTALAEPGKIKGGAVTLLASLGHVGRHVQEDVTARLPTDEEREIFSLGAHDPVLVMTRLIRDEHDRPIEVDVMTMPARGGRLRYELKVG
jgi:GntR family transcriptional regulator